MPLGNIAGKGENAGNKHFLQQLLSFFHGQTYLFELRFIGRLRTLSLWSTVKFCSLVDWY